MSEQLICDGCGRRLRRETWGRSGTWELMVTGERVTMRAAEGRFDWCLDCAQAAFAGVAARRERGRPS